MGELQMMMEEMVGEAGGIDSMAAMMFGKIYPSTPQPPLLLGHLTALKVGGCNAQYCGQLPQPG